MDVAGDASCWPAANDGPVGRIPLHTSTGVIRVSQTLACVIAPDRSVACIDAQGVPTAHAATALDLDVWGTTVCWLDAERGVLCSSDGLPTAPSVESALQIDVGAHAEQGPSVCALNQSGEVECASAEFFGW